MNYRHRRINKITDKILRFTGIWPLELSAPTLFRLLHPIFRLVNLTLFLLLLTSSLIDSTNNIKDLTMFTENLCFFFGTGTTLIKALIFSARRKTIQQLVAEIYGPIDLLRQSTDSQVQTTINVTAHQEAKEFYFLCVLVTSMGLARIVSGRKTENGLPLPTYYPFDTSKSPIYQIVYFYESYCIAFNLMAVMITDFIVICFMKWLTVLLKIISSNYKNCDSESVKRSLFIATFDPKTIKTSDKIDNDIEQIDIRSFVSYEDLSQHDINNNSANSYNERLKLCIKQHQKIIKVVDDLNTIFGRYMLMQIATSTALICLNGFQVIVCKDSSTVVRFFISLIASFVQLLFWCWYGNKFVSMADTLIISQWISGWENSFNRSIKNLLTISMIQTLRPLEFHALGFFKFTIPTFVDILRKSYSVFVLLTRTLSD